MLSRPIIMPRLNVGKLERKLAALTKSKDSIQTLSAWILHHKDVHQEIAAEWLKAVKKSDTPHRLTLFYLANDVLQHCKKKNAAEYKLSFADVLEEAVVLTKDLSIKYEVLRMIAIWSERNVYSVEFLKQLENIVREDEMSPGGVAAPSRRALDDDLVLAAEQLVDEVQEVEEEVVKTEAEIISSFKLEDLIGCLQQLSEVQKMASACLEALVEFKFPRLDAIDKKTIGLESLKTSEKLDTAARLITDYLDKAEEEVALRKDVAKLLEYSKVFYSAQNEEVRKVVHAYRIFGKKINLMQQKLTEKMQTLPESSEPNLQPPSIETREEQPVPSSSKQSFTSGPAEESPAVSKSPAKPSSNIRLSLDKRLSMLMNFAGSSSVLVSVVSEMEVNKTPAKSADAVSECAAGSSSSSSPTAAPAGTVKKTVKRKSASDSAGGKEVSVPKEGKTAVGSAKSTESVEQDPKKTTVVKKVKKKVKRVIMPGDASSSLVSSSKTKSDEEKALASGKPDSDSLPTEQKAEAKSNEAIAEQGETLASKASTETAATPPPTTTTAASTEGKTKPSQGQKTGSPAKLSKSTKVSISSPSSTTHEKSHLSPTAKISPLKSKTAAKKSDKSSTVSQLFTEKKISVSDKPLPDEEQSQEIATIAEAQPAMSQPVEQTPAHVPQQPASPKHTTDIMLKSAEPSDELMDTDALDNSGKVPLDEAVDIDAEKQVKTSESSATSTTAQGAKEEAKDSQAASSKDVTEGAAEKAELSEKLDTKEDTSAKAEDPLADEGHKSDEETKVETCEKSENAGALSSSESAGDSSQNKGPVKFVLSPLGYESLDLMDIDSCEVVDEKAGDRTPKDLQVVSGHAYNDSEKGESKAADKEDLDAAKTPTRQKSHEQTEPENSVDVKMCLLQSLKLLNSLLSIKKTEDSSLPEKNENSDVVPISTVLRIISCQGLKPEFSTLSGGKKCQENIGISEAKHDNASGVYNGAVNGISKHDYNANEQHGSNLEPMDMDIDSDDD